MEVSAVIPRTLNLQCNIPIIIGNLSSLISERRVTALVGAIVLALVQNRAVVTSRHDGADKNQQQYEFSSYLITTTSTFDFDKCKVFKTFGPCMKILTLDLLS